MIRKGQLQTESTVDSLQVLFFASSLVVFRNTQTLGQSTPPYQRE